MEDFRDVTGTRGNAPSDCHHLLYERLIEEVERLTNALARSSPAELTTLRSDCLALRLHVERMFRRHQVVHPESEPEFSVALWWLSEQGNFDDLILLRRLKDRPMLNPDQRRLLDLTENITAHRSFRSEESSQHNVRETLRGYESLIWCIFTVCAGTLGLSLVLLSATWLRFALAFSSGVVAYECIIVIRRIKTKLSAPSRQAGSQ
jgi:hypothetical protein